MDQRQRQKNNEKMSRKSHPNQRIFEAFQRPKISALVVAEHEGGFVKPSSLSCVAATGSISKEKSISILLSGSGASLQKAAVQAASCHPLVSEVLVVDADMLTHPLVETRAELIHLVQQKGSYSYVVAASNSFGKNVLPRAATLLDVSPIIDVIEIFEPRIFVRAIYAWNALCTVRYTGLDPSVITIRSTSFSVPPISEDAVSDAAPLPQDTMMMGDDYYQTEAEIASLLAEGKVSTSVGPNTMIRDCIIDKIPKIGKDVIIANKDESRKPILTAPMAMMEISQIQMTRI